MAYPLLLDWYDANRRVLPFRGTRDPYAVWISEIMLQQTRTDTVSGYYTRFLNRFPNIAALAQADEQEVLKYWEGLGYYSRARNLHKAAQIMQREYGGRFPAAYEGIRALPGVGDYTAAAVASIAYRLPYPAIDGNLTRVLARVHGVREDVGRPSVKRLIHELGEREIDRERPGDWNQALMDLGATICVPGTPDCARCPLQAQCDAYAQGDADQLPSVGAGNVLGDILRSGVIASVRLNEIFRQSESSLIVRNAHAINHGEMPVLNQKNSNFFFERHAYPEDSARAVVELCRRRLPAYMKCADPLHAIQVLSPTKKGACGVIALNAMLQAALNPPCPEKPEIQYGERIFRQGDKVMHIKNNYQLEWMGEDDSDGTGVFNGDMGVVLTVDTEEKTLVVFFDDGRTAEYEYAMLEELELAYCLSVHKSQGSEFACVVMPCVGGPPMLLTRNLFYTALTRAKELVVLVGREDAISAMVNNNHIARRYTALCQRLGEIPAGE